MTQVIRQEQGDLSLHLESMITTLGRETPYQLHYLESAEKLLVCYADAVVLYSLESEQWTRSASRHFSSVVSDVRESAEMIILAGTGRVAILDYELNPIHELPHFEDESIQDLLSVNDHTFLTISDTSSVACWAAPNNSEPSPAFHWPVECQPLWSLPSGKLVLCSERGRLQERDALNGTVLKTWPKSPPIYWATGDSQGQHLLAVDETGEASLWDASSRECLFNFTTNFTVVRGYFEKSGLRGALLGSEGEVATFKVVEGGMTATLEAPQTPLVSLATVSGRWLGLDENGGLWWLGESEPTRAGGCWAGWATCTLRPNQEELLVGTAHGTVECFRDFEHLGGEQLHHDAIVKLAWFNGVLFSVGADATVCQASLREGRLEDRLTLFEHPGRLVVDAAFDTESGRLWLGLDEGLLCWLDLTDTEESDEIQLEDRRIEELSDAGPAGVAVLTDRGSVRWIRP